jgi:hypothetical protein
MKTTKKPLLKTNSIRAEAQIEGAPLALKKFANKKSGY